MSSPHAGKSYVVTGVSSGIGACTAAHLKRAGARVIGIDIQPAPACDEFFSADLGNANAIDQLVARLPSGVSGLANVAGVPPTFVSDAVLRINFLGVRRLSLGLLSKLANGSSIVNVASLAGFGWQKNLTNVNKLLAADFGDDLAKLSHELELDRAGRSYFLTKETLMFWTYQNRWTWRDRDIRMNCVSPGPVVTPIHQDFLATLGARAEEDARLMDRPAFPEDIAPVIAFMLSPESGWIKGANIPVDGGMSGKLMVDETDAAS